MSEELKPAYAEPIVATDNAGEASLTLRRGSTSDIVIAFIVAAMFIAGLLWFSVTYGDGSKRPIMLLSGLIGGALGWVLGILASPYNRDERESFTSMGKLVYGFLSGYVVSKVDPLLTGLLSDARSGAPSGDYLAFGGVALVSFLIVLGVTYISRTYWVDDKQPQKQ